MKKDKKVFCHSKHSNKGRFMEACLLTLLKEKSDYGYGLVERLEDFHFDEDEVNMSAIYRSLKSMEDKELVLADWAESEEGPNRKIFEITPQGEEELEAWIYLIKNRKKRIEAIIDKYEELR